MTFAKGNKAGKWTSLPFKPVEKTPLTDRQKEIFEFVCLYMEKYKVPPTRQEISSAFNFASTNAAQEHLEALAKKGWIRLLGTGSAFGRVARGIRIV